MFPCILFMYIVPAKQNVNVPFLSALQGSDYPTVSLIKQQIADRKLSFSVDGSQVK